MPRALQSVKVKHSKHTANLQPVRIPVPEKVIIPMLQHMGAPCEPVVKVNDAVTVGQLIGDSDQFLSSPIHSSVSGTVSAINDFVTAMGIKCKAVVITTDGQQTPCPHLAPPQVKNHADLVAAVRNCGLVGLGGAGFPTHIKLNPKNLDRVDTLVINGAECEPYITSDMRLMLDHTDSLLSGITVLKKYLGVPQVVIGIEENKPEAIQKLTQATASMTGVAVKTLKARYPQGAEKVLIYETTGRIVEEGKLPADTGVLVLNVTTCAKIDHYLKTGMPLVEKTITVDGSAIATPKNVIAPLGTLFSDIIAFCGGYKAPVKKILMGGPMMGVAVPSDQFPLLKNNNALLAFNEEEGKVEQETACIRCGRCVRACPLDLTPVALDKAYRARNVEALRQYKVNLCMECGCCSYVCPAKRYLVMSNRLGKKLLRESNL